MDTSLLGTPFLFVPSSREEARGQERMARQSVGWGGLWGDLGNGVGGGGRGLPPVCEETVASLPLTPQRSASVIPPARCGAGLFVCVRGCGWACVCGVGVALCRLLHRGGFCASPPPLCVLPVWQGQEGCEANGEPGPPLPSCLSLCPTLSLPVLWKMPKYRM